VLGIRMRKVDAWRRDRQVFDRANIWK
jgi:hypothetical protein